MHPCAEVDQVLLRDLVDVGHGLYAQSFDEHRLELMLEQEGAQPRIDLIVIGCGDGHSARAYTLESIDDAVTHGGRLKARGSHDRVTQLPVEHLTLVKRQRGSGQLYGFCAGSSQFPRRLGYTRQRGIKAVGRHALYAQTGGDVAQALTVHGHTLFGDF